MGIDLVGAGGSISLSFDFWRDCHRLAVAFGWHPGGTIGPHQLSSDWDGGYFTNDWQLVTDDDAKAMAAALYRAVAAVHERRSLHNNSPPYHPST